MSSVSHFLKTRIISISEVIEILLGRNMAYCNIDVKFLPTLFDPSIKIIKRKEHINNNVNKYHLTKENLFYDNLFEKYLDRPDNLKDMLYSE